MLSFILKASMQKTPKNQKTKKKKKLYHTKKLCTSERLRDWNLG